MKLMLYDRHRSGIASHFPTFHAAGRCLADRLDAWKERREIVKAMRAGKTPETIRSDPPSPRSVESLSALLSHRHDSVRSFAAFYLGELCVRGYPIDRSIPHLVRTLADGNFWVRLDAAKVLLLASTRSSGACILSMLGSIHELVHSPFIELDLAENEWAGRNTAEAAVTILRSIRRTTGIETISELRLRRLINRIDGRPFSSGFSAGEEYQ
jgi:hypothetical protein